MQLKYRGVQYDQDLPTVEMIPRQVSGMYRGQRFGFEYPKHVPVAQSLRGLFYRGVAYATDAAGCIESVHAPVHAPVRSGVPSEVTPTLSLLEYNLRKKRAVEADKKHQHSILERLQHRIEVARAQGNEQLLHQLEQELQQCS